jgi:hypothetical protein
VIPAAARVGPMRTQRGLVTVYLTCPERAELFEIGPARRGSDGRVSGLVAAVRRSDGDYLTALDRFVGDCRSALSLAIEDTEGHEGPVIGPAGLAYEESSVGATPATVTYFGLLSPGFTPAGPSGLIRRKQAGSARPVDEAFTRRGRWEPSHYLERYRLGHNDIDHVEVAEPVALAFVIDVLAGLPVAEPSTPPPPA